MTAPGTLGNRRRWWILGSVALAGFVGMALLWFGGSRLGSPKEASGRDKAALAYRRGDWQGAADLARVLLRSNDGRPEVLRTYARSLARLGRDDSAWMIYNNRLKVDQMEGEDYLLLGTLLLRRNQLEPAFEVWTKGGKLAPDHPELLDQFARLAIRLQRLDQAVDASKKLAKLPGWEARGSFLVAEVASLLDDPKGVVDGVRDGFDADPKAKGASLPASQYRLLLARNLLRMHRPAEAVTALGPLSGTSEPAEDSTSREAHWLLGRAYLQQGHLAEALAEGRRAGTYRADNPLAFEPAPYVGEASCASCHPRESREHARTRHARTFHHGAGLLDLPIPERPLADPDVPGVTHTFQRDGGRIRVQTKTVDRTYNALMEFAFGTRDRYVTMVGKDEDKTARSPRLSFYHGKDGLGWDRTSGDIPDPNPLEDIRGERVSVRDGVIRCLYCHVTRSRDFRSPPPEEGVGPEAADTAIGCERCHGPGGHHVAALKAGFPDKGIVNAGTASASSVVTQCADCHIVGVPEQILATPDDPQYVRAPGVTFTASRCYTESAGAMSCLTCHDPHRDDEGPASVFEAKCLGCHSSSTASQKSCRVNPAKDCLNCHMPKVELPHLHTALTDHYIRIHKNPKK